MTDNTSARSDQIESVTQDVDGSSPKFIETVRAYTEKREFSGVLLAQRGDETVRYHAGMANASWNIAMTPDARFQIYSVTKTVTAVAVLRRVAQKILQLDQSVCDILKFAPDSWAPITIRHLLAHRSGLSSPGRMSDAWTGDFLETVRVVLERSDDDVAPGTTPGETYSYSNYGYVLLAAVLQAATSDSFHDVIGELVFQPAGMTDALTARGARPEDFHLPVDLGDREEEIRTSLLQDAGPVSVSRLVSGYDGNPETLIHVNVNGAMQLGASGVYATAEDLQAFLNALFVDKTLLSEEALDTMTTPYGGGDNGYGLGLTIRRGSDGVKLYHTGGMNGFQIHAGYYPETSGMVVYLSNHGFAPIKEIVGQMEAWSMNGKQ